MTFSSPGLRNVAFIGLMPLGQCKSRLKNVWRQFKVVFYIGKMSKDDIEVGRGHKPGRRRELSGPADP